MNKYKNFFCFFVIIFEVLKYDERRLRGGDVMVVVKVMSVDVDLLVRLFRVEVEGEGK